MKKGQKNTTLRTSNRKIARFNAIAILKTVCALVVSAAIVLFTLTVKDGKMLNGKEDQLQQKEAQVKMTEKLLIESKSDDWRLLDKSSKVMASLARLAFDAASSIGFSTSIITGDASDDDERVIGREMTPVDINIQMPQHWDLPTAAIAAKAWYGETTKSLPISLVSISFGVAGNTVITVRSQVMGEKDALE